MSVKVLTCSLIASTMLVGVLHAAAPEIPLLDAIRKTDRAAVRTLLKQTDVNSTEADGTTALHWATHLDDLETVQLLLQAGANVAARNRFGSTPLGLACLNGNSAMIETLLKAGADVNATVGEGETPLMTAARTGKLDAVKVLLNRGANVNMKEGWRGQTALMWAAAEGYAPVIRLLVEKGADLHARSNGGFTPLLFAAREGKIDAVQTLLALGADLNDALPVSRRNAAADPPAVPEKGSNALLLAAGNAHYELAAILLDRGSDPNAAPQGWTALHQISWVRKAGIAGSNDPAPEGSGNMTSLEFVRKLVAKGANVNSLVTKRPPAGVTELNMIGGTPLFLAARTADAELMQLLVDLGADPSLRNADETTTLMAAAGVGTRAPGEDPGTESEMVEAVKLALDLGNNVNSVDKNGETAMHGAAAKFAASIVQLLAANGAKSQIWNQKNKKGYTPLSIAQGVQRGMNVVGHPATADAIRKALADDSLVR